MTTPINFSEPERTWIQNLEDDLTPNSSGEHHPKSFMDYDIICRHNEGFMCACRAKHIIDIIKQNTK